MYAGSIVDAQTPAGKRLEEYAGKTWVLDNARTHAKLTTEEHKERLEPTTV